MERAAALSGASLTAGAVRARLGYPGGMATRRSFIATSALAAGVAALVRADDPSLPVKKVIKRLQDSASRLCDT